MKRNIKKLYAEIILDTIINYTWEKDSIDYGVFVIRTDRFRSPQKKVGSYAYQFTYYARGLLLREVKVSVGESYYSANTETLKFSIFSKLFWRLIQMRNDYYSNIKMSEINKHMDFYKTFKEGVIKRDIQKLEQSIANLSKAEEEQRKMLEELKAKEVK